MTWGEGLGELSPKDYARKMQRARIEEAQAKKRRAVTVPAESWWLGLTREQHQAEAAKRFTDADDGGDHDG